MKCQALKCFEPPGKIICAEEREEMSPQMSVVFIVKFRSPVICVSGLGCESLPIFPGLPEVNRSWVMPCLWRVRPKG